MAYFTDLNEIARLDLRVVCDGMTDKGPDLVQPLTAMETKTDITMNGFPVYLVQDLPDLVRVVRESASVPLPVGFHSELVIETFDEYGRKKYTNHTEKQKENEK